MQAAAVEDVQHLHATADTHDGHVEFIAVAQDQMLELFAARQMIGHARIIFGVPITHRIDILPAGQQEAIHVREDGLVGTNVVRDGKQVGFRASRAHRERVMVDAVVVRLRQLGGNDPHYGLMMRVRFGHALPPCIRYLTSNCRR